MQASLFGLGASALTAVTAGGYHTLALSGDGSVWAYGWNIAGELGDGTVTERHVPVQVSGLTAITAVSTGYVHSLALRGDGTVWAWGDNTYGQLGDGTITSRLTPVQVSGLTGVTAVSAGYVHNLALKGDGTVWVWGADGTTPTFRLIPVQVSGLTGVTAVGAGEAFSLAVTSDATVWAWGHNSDGQLGDGTTTNRVSPVQVAALNGVSVVSANNGDSLAVKRDGTAWAWGWNWGGRLGDGTTTSRLMPVQVAALTGATAVAAGGDQTLALKGDGTVWAWGDNAHGQLGDGTTTRRTTPVRVSGLTGATAVSTGSSHSVAIKGDGTVWGWGANNHGQLGDGTTTDRLTPVTLQSLLGGPAGTDQNLPNPNGDLSRGGVQIATGNFTWTHVDVSTSGRGPSPVFERTYNSDDMEVGMLGRGWTSNYATSLRTPGDGSRDVLLFGPAGRSDRYVHNSDGSYALPPAITTTLKLNTDGTYLATLSDQTLWLFASTGTLTSITDRNGNQSNLTYNANGELTSIGDPAGRGALTLAYAKCGGYSRRLCSITDWQTPAYRTVSYSYDTFGDLMNVTDRNGKQTIYFDGQGFYVTKITDANAHVQVTNHYDTGGRVDWQKDALGLSTGQQTTFTYDATPACTSPTPPSPAVCTNTVSYPTTSFDNSNPSVADTFSGAQLSQRVTKPSSSETLTESFGYNASGFRNQITDARGNTTSFCYDVDYTGATIPGSRGNLTRRIEPTVYGSHPVSLFKFDTTQDVLETYSPKGVASSPTTGCSDNLSAGLNALYATASSYDASGNVKTVTQHFTDPDLGAQTATTQYLFGDAQNPGRVTAVISPRNNITSFAYFQPGDSQAGLLRSAPDPLGNTTTNGYDAVGRKTSMVDANGNASGANPADHTSTFTYDNEDRPLFAKAPAPLSGGAPLATESRYDAVGNRTVQIDANGQVTTFAFDSRNLLQEQDESPNAWTDPNATPSPKIATTYQHDNLGQLSRVTRAAGDSSNERATDYAWDGLNRLRKEIQYPNWPTTSPTLGTQFSYDGNGNQVTFVDPLAQTTTSVFDALNRLTSVSYSDGQTPNVTYAYDANGNRTSMGDGSGNTGYVVDELGRPTGITSPGPKTVGYRYNLDGNRNKVIYPDGTAVTSAFDTAGRMQSLVDWAARGTSYTYFPDAQLKQIANVNGTTGKFAYDNAQRLGQVLNQQGTSTLDQHTYTLDNVGNRTQAAEILAQVGGGSISPATVYSYDKLSRLATDGTNNYAYDPLGNRLVWGATNYSYDRADRITAAGTTSYSVNANGNLIARGSDTFIYDQANRLTSATVGGSTSTWTYDGDGKRGSVTVGGTTTSYVYDVSGKLPMLLVDGTRKYVYGQGLAYETDLSGNVQAVTHADGVGSVRALTDGSGNLIQTYRTDPFGVPTANQGSSTQPLGFTGEQTDPSGFVYLRARMYDPQTGRFLQRDTFAKTGPGVSGWNRYAYAGDNPVSFSDPSGHCLEDACVGEAIVCAAACPYIVAGGFALIGGAIVFKDQLVQGTTAAAESLLGMVGVPQWFPDRQLPRDPRTGDAIPEVDQEGKPILAPHTQVGTRTSRSGRGPATYPQAREFDENGNPVRDIDWTDHGRPQVPGHVIPHQHPYDPQTGSRGDAEPLPTP